MKLAVALAFLAAPVSFGQAGHWEGVLKNEGHEVLFSIDLDDRPDWHGTFLIPGQNAPPLPLAALSVRERAVQFEVRDLPGNPVFKGILGEQGSSIRGTAAQGNAVIAFDMRRTGDAHVEPIPVNTSLDDRFLGDWTGALAQETPLLLTVHLRLVAGAGSGTIDTADGRAKNLLLSALRQDGFKLSFDVRLIGGHFDGECDSAGSTIAGTWLQDGVATALRLERKK